MRRIVTLLLAGVVALVPCPASAQSASPDDARFVTLYPDAKFAALYVLVGRMTSGGTTSGDRLLIGTEPR